MLLDKIIEYISKNGRTRYKYLIKCNGCGKEEWLSGKECNFGKKKFCSRRCINLGKVRSCEWKSKMSEMNSGSKNAFYGKKHSCESRSKMSKNHTSENSLKSIKMSELSEEDFEKYWNAYREKLSGKNNHFYGKTHSKEVREHLSNIRSEKISKGEIDLKPSHYGLKGYYVSVKSNEKFRYDSFLELIRMRMLDIDDAVISWTKRHGIRIKYEIDGYQRNFVPDFLIEINNGIILEETKGYERKDKKELKFEALKKYCKDNNIKSSIVTYEYADELCIFYFGKRIQQLRKEYKKG